MNFKISLRIMAIVFWFYIPVFVLSVLPLTGIEIPQLFFTEYRGPEYIWDFELMFTVIFGIWGYFLWKASYAPEKSTTFIQFSMWASAGHIVSMLVVGIVRPNDLAHMIQDAMVQIIPLLLVIVSYRTFTRDFKR